MIRQSRSVLLGSALAGTVVVLGAAAPSASAQLQVVLNGTQIVAIQVGSTTYPASVLSTGTSAGATLSGSIGAADDLDLATYFARNGGIPPAWDVTFPAPVSFQPDPGPELFVFEAGGNDPVQVAAILAGGAIGQPVPLGAWTATGPGLTNGANQGQQVYGAVLDVESLLDPSGAPLAFGQQLAGVRLLSDAIDGAAFLFRVPAPLLPGTTLPRIVLSPPTIPENDFDQTVVTISAEPWSTGQLAPSDYQFTWSIAGATYVQGTTPNDPTVRVTFPGDDPPLVELLVAPTSDPGLVEKATAEVGLELPVAPPHLVVLHGDPRVWHTTELWFDGPHATMFDDAPNPFLDYRFELSLQRPDGTTQLVPGFFDGDGLGGGAGSVYKVRVLPEVAGTWTWTASFVKGTNVAVVPSPTEKTASFHGLTGKFDIAPRDPNAPGFLKWGLLERTDDHYNKFRDGPWFVKAGCASPENFLAFSGFLDVQKQPNGKGIVHEYEPHLDDWTTADPVMPIANTLESRAIFGVFNYFESVGINSIYFMPMNLGGDAQDTTPTVGYQKTSFDKTHYHVGRLLQWEAVFEHAQRKGVMLHFVFAETEPANENWFDGGGFGIERKLYYRELVARFAHHPAIKWNLSEENDFHVTLLKQKAQWLRAIDPWDHQIAVHNSPDDYQIFDSLLGDTNFDSTSIQYPPSDGGMVVETMRTNSSAAGHRWSVEMDENMPGGIGLTTTNATELRRKTLYDVYFSGGQISWFLGANDFDVEDFRSREEMWTYARHASSLVRSMPFHAMQPLDHFVVGATTNFGGVEVFGIPGELYLVYVPDASQPGSLFFGDQTRAFVRQWFDPRTGELFPPEELVGSGHVPIGIPPSAGNFDWVLVYQRLKLWSPDDSVSVSSPAPVQLMIDAGAFHAGRPYWLLGSASGTTPGIDVGSGLTLPLQPDGYFLYTLAAPNAPPLSGSIGLLDAAGRATTVFELPPPAQIPPNLVGLTLQHAWVTGESAVTLTSNPYPLRIDP